MKKIMFNDKYGLTKAVLDGRKTQTRRFVPKEFFTLQWDERDDWESNPYVFVYDFELIK